MNITSVACRNASLSLGLGTVPTGMTVFTNTFEKMRDYLRANTTIVDSVNLARYALNAMFVGIFVCSILLGSVRMGGSARMLIPVGRRIFLGLR